MTARPSFVRRTLEWLWRGQRLRDLKAAHTPVDRRALAQARSFRTLAWRTLGGLEPVPASTRVPAARPLLLAGMQAALPLLPAPLGSIDELFDAPSFQPQLEGVGITSAQAGELREWLASPSAQNQPERAELALLLLDTLIDATNESGAAIARVRFWRLGVLTALLAFVGTLIALIVVLISPPEGKDLAVNKPWRASSAYVGYTIEGRKAEHPSEVAFFCTNEDEGAWWQIDLQSAKTIGSLTLVNRSDCCAERATPLAIEVSTDGTTWREVIRRDETFRTWRPRFKAVKARYVRLRALRRTFLHMKDVRIQAPATK